MSIETDMKDDAFYRLNEIRAKEELYRGLITNTISAEEYDIAMERVNQHKIDNEKDPSGINQHTKGAKLDAGKPQVATVLDGFSRAVLEVSKVGTFGIAKYSKDGWQHVDNGFERYSNAMLRHYLAEQSETIDKDSELLHIAQTAWNALARLELYLRDNDEK